MMPPDAAVVSVATLREAARRHAERVGLRDAAADVGMSFSGLRTFLAGTDPRHSTVRKLREWYAKTPEGRGMSVERARANLAALLEHLPSEERAAVRLAFLESVERACKRATVDVPRWVEELRGE